LIDELSGGGLDNSAFRDFKDLDRAGRRRRDDGFIREIEGESRGGRDVSITQHISASLTSISDDDDEAEFQRMMLKMMPKLLRKPAMRRALKDAVKNL